ncbi:MAG: AAA family ATPase [Planctomycetota bacterium]|nr:AAA family ATPase [Planctomycetota bacterium]
MYEQHFDLTGHFDLTERPFGSAPNAGCWFPAEAIEQARLMLTQSIDLAGGVGLLVGPSGTGKSLLVERLAADFGTTFQVVTLASTRLCSRRALLQNILFELKRPYRGLAEGELRLDLIEHLRTLQDGVRGVLFLVDEAHGLPLKLLDELRMLTNVVRDGDPCAQLVLAGTANLEEKMADPRMHSLNQRISARGYLESMVYAESCDYVRFQIGRVGGGGDLFSEDALGAIYHASGGMPRVINQLCTHVLVSIAQRQESQVTETAVERAWAELQQLPAPWNEHPTTSGTGDVGQEPGDAGVIEFGPLEDEIPPPVTVEAAEPVGAAGNAPDNPERPVAMEAVMNGAIPEPNSAASMQDTEDPFAEEFEEECLVHDRYQAGPVDMSQTGDLVPQVEPMVAIPGFDLNAAGARAMQSSLSSDQHLMPLTITVEERDSQQTPAQQPGQAVAEMPDEVRKRREVASLIEDMAAPLRAGAVNPCLPSESGSGSTPEAVAPPGRAQAPVAGDGLRHCQNVAQTQPGMCPEPAESTVVSCDLGPSDAYLVLHSQSTTESILYSQPVAEPHPIRTAPDLPSAGTQAPISDETPAASVTQQQQAFRDLLKPFVSTDRGRAAG